MKKLVMTMSALSALTAAPEIALAKPACDELAGSVIFYDTLYGVGTGVVLAGLYLVAAEDGEDVGRKVAGAGLAGAGIGVIAGTLELALRDCGGPTTQVRKGFAPRLALVDGRPAAGLIWRW